MPKKFKIKIVKPLAIIFTPALYVTSSIWINAYAQSTMPPPALGQDTKGTPAISELQDDENQESNTVIESASDTPTKKSEEKAPKRKVIDSLLGSATITESKRESGQRYLIELEHSAGTKQYIEETDSDGKLESTSNDIEETPNLPKWKIGSW